MQKVKLGVHFCVSHWVRWPEAVPFIVLSGEGRAESFHDCAVSIQHLISPLRVFMRSQYSANNLFSTHPSQYDT